MRDLVSYLLGALALVGAVFLAGHVNGYKKAQDDVDAANEKAQASEDAAATAKAEAEARIQATEDAHDVQQNVDALSNDAVDQQLLDRWGRPDSGD